MKIGIEAKWLFRGPPSGQRVVFNLVQSLIEDSGADELHFFLDARFRDEPMPANVPAERRHYVWAGNNQLSNVFLVPRAADRAGLDAVVYQNFVPPRAGVAHARIAFVHDVIFRSHPQFFNWRERLYFAPLRFLSSSADRVCTVSQSERARLARYNYADADRIDVVPNAVDDTFVPRERLSATLIDRTLDAVGVKEPYVLFVGRLTARKNVDALVRAMAHVETANLELIVVGAADETSPDLVGIAASVGVGDRVRFIGALDIGDERLRVLYACAAVFCFPSLEESFGLPPLEAMASGTPVIVSDVAAVVEICGDAAIYVDARSPTALAIAIDELMANSDLRDELRARGTRRAREFTWARSAARLLETVHAAVESRT
jgi:glycosyltransferase involved in cell wall biosynthesis